MLYQSASSVTKKDPNAFLARCRDIDCPNCPTNFTLNTHVTGSFLVLHLPTVITLLFRNYPHIYLPLIR
jgi:uncharacterized protein (DUF2225 family)